MAVSSRPIFQLALPHRTIELGRRTLIMGVLNVTPDSFSDGGRFLDPATAVSHARRIAAEGADILDIGGESTRPGAPPVGIDEELSRVIPVLEGLGSDYPIPVSIDTSKAEVARAALERGAAIVNDVTALGGDPEMARVVSGAGAAVVLMHMRGTPGDMQKRPPSTDILAEIESWAPEAVERATKVGISCDRIVLDPGIGFGKTVSQNLAILRNLGRLASTGFPLLVGTSRKSFIGAVLRDPAADRAWGTGATVAASILLGAHIVRVHDVAAMRQVAVVSDAILAERAPE
jgi:dihydropteroate synthase